MKLKQNFNIFNNQKKKRIPVPVYNVPLSPLPSAHSKSCRTSMTAVKCTSDLKSKEKQEKLGYIC